MSKRVAIIFGVVYYSLIFIIISSIAFNKPSTPSQESRTNETEITQQTEEAVIADNDTEAEKYEVLSVTDGDTIRIDYNGVSTPLRLIGIDTPEINHPSEPIQCYGVEASQRLKDMLLGQYIEIEKDVSERDTYDRLLRYVWLNGELINEKLVREGYALASSYPPDIKYQDRINIAEREAREVLRGFWSPSTCNGDIYTGTYKDPSFVAPEPTPTVSVPAPAPTPTPALIPTPAPVVTAPIQQESGYNCSCSKTCPNMSSCEEAYYQLNVCGCSARDGDKDGVPCESICN
ncbi:thermonuclease family protein [Patescibacteria group bacterium]